VHGHDADDIVGSLDHDRLEAIAVGDDFGHPLERIRLRGLERKEVDPVARDHHELSRVERIRAFTEDLPLRTALPAGAQELSNILKIVGGYVLRERLCGREGLAVAREHVSDSALRDRDQRHFVNAVLKRHQHVPAASKQVRLESRFTVERDEPGLHRTGRAPEPLDNANPVIGDVPKGEDERRNDKQGEQHPQHKRQIHGEHAFLSRRRCLLYPD
jgi:hypothetical protein